MKSIIIKIGGSVLYEEGLKLNILALEKLKEWYAKYSHDYEKVCFVVGGGKLSREVGGILKGHVRRDDDKHCYKK